MNDYAGLCSGCFQAKGKAAVCAQCGYDERQKRSLLVLPHRTLLHHGQFLIGRVLGKPGGFGITYLGYDTRLQTRVAIKEYLPRDQAGRDTDHLTVTAHSQEEQEFFNYGLTQFLNEARTLAQFDHPAVVRVRSFFEENATGYLVMDYYEGLSLTEHLQQQQGGRLPEKLAVGIMMPILDGLREVHAKGFLHRDIKPANIYLTTDKRPILLDFGAARFAMSERSRSLSVVLTEGYAPYEQYHRRGEQGAWTDIYACAAVLYHMVTGQVPPPATDRKEHDELQDPRAFGASPAFTDAVLKGLAMTPAQRPATVHEFQDLLLGEPADKNRDTENKNDSFTNDHVTNNQTPFGRTHSNSTAKIARKRNPATTLLIVAAACLLIGVVTRHWLFFLIGLFPLSLGSFLALYSSVGVRRKPASSTILVFGVALFIISYNHGFSTDVGTLVIPAVFLLSAGITLKATPASSRQKRIVLLLLTTITSIFLSITLVWVVVIAMRILALA